MQIFCVLQGKGPTPCQCTLTLEVEETDSIQQVKEIIQSQLGRPCVDQQLHYADQLLENNKRLSDYSVLGGSTIQLTLLLARCESNEVQEIAKLQDNFSRLCDGITNPEMFAARLFSARLISAEVRQHAELTTLIACVRVVKLISAVEAQIRISPTENFKKFIKVLCKDPAHVCLAECLDLQLAREFQPPSLDSVERPLTPPVDMDSSDSTVGQAQDGATMRLSLAEVKNKMTNLEERFEDLTFEMHEELLKIVENKPESIKRIKHSLSLLPTDIRKEHYRFLTKEMNNFKETKDVEDIFGHLNLYWTYFDYSMLKVLVDKYASDGLKEKMEKYVKDMKIFRQQTIVSDFVKVWPGRDDPPENTFTKLKTVVKKDASHCTLEELDRLRRDFCSAYHLSDTAVMLQRLEQGSVVIMWLMPAELVRPLMSTIKRTSIEVFCVSQNLQCVIVGEHKVYADDVFEELIVPGQNNLAVLVDKRGSECLNEMDKHSYIDALLPGPLQYLESDCDEQLIISLCFRTPVKLHSIQLTGPIDGRAPKNIRLFINQEQTLDFSQAQERTPVQEFILTEKDTGHDSLIQLKHALKYQNVRNLTIFIKDNQGDKKTTVVHHIGLYGDTIEAIDMSQFQRVAGVEGEEHVHNWQFHCP